MRTAAQVIAAAAAVLEAAGIADPRREARLLLGHAAGMGQAALLRDLHEPLLAPGFATLVRRRAAREPMALITGRQGFWSLELAVTPDTLIPRADSEAVVEAALAACGNGPDGMILDLGTGTGCLLLALLSEWPLATGVGVDRAAGAARLARLNAAALGLAGRAAFVCGGWAAAIGGRFGLVVSNPPYIASAELPGLMPEVRQHEPMLALDGGEDGLDAYRAIIAALPGLLAPGGAAVLELGQGQADAVGALAESGGLAVGGRHADLGGIARALVLRAAPGKKPFGTVDWPG